MCRFLLFSCPANAILASFPELIKAWSLTYEEEEGLDPPQNVSPQKYDPPLRDNFANSSCQYYNKRTQICDPPTVDPNLNPLPKFIGPSLSSI